MDRAAYFIFTVIGMGGGNNRQNKWISSGLEAVIWMRELFSLPLLQVTILQHLF